jgi:hypothetical protein
MLNVNVRQYGPVTTYSIFWKFLNVIPVNRWSLLLQEAMKKLCKAIEVLFYRRLSHIRYRTQQLIQFMLQLDLRISLRQLLELS